MSTLSTEARVEHTFAMNRWFYKDEIKKCDRRGSVVATPFLPGSASHTRSPSHPLLCPIAAARVEQALYH